MNACDWPFKTVEIQYDHCGRFGRYRKETYLEIVGEVAYAIEPGNDLSLFGEMRLEPVAGIQRSSPAGGRGSESAS